MTNVSLVYGNLRGKKRGCLRDEPCLMNVELSV